jgi:hypothetical protein
MSDDPLKSHEGTREEDMGRGLEEVAAVYHVESSRNNQSDSLFTCYRVDVYTRGNNATQLVNSKVIHSQRVGPSNGHQMLTGRSLSKMSTSHVRSLHYQKEEDTCRGLKCGEAR